MAEYEMPQLMTAEEAEKKAALIKATAEVADTVDMLKKALEEKGWSQAEMASLTLFNTLLMTSFSEQYKSKVDENEKKLTEFRERVLELATLRLKDRGFHGLVVTDCLAMIADGREEKQIRAVWEDYFGENTGSVLFSSYRKAHADITKEDEEAAL